MEGRAPDYSQLPTLGYGDMYGDPPLVTFCLNLLCCFVVAEFIAFLFVVVDVLLRMAL